ncbi:hypothetical protein ACSBR2_006401 [Camellia fascicularis]
MELTENEKSRPPLIQVQPWLLIYHGKYRQFQNFYNVSEDYCYIKKIPELCNKQICTSSYGWLVLENLDSDECFLLNLVSMDKIQLPLRESTYDFCVLTLPPSDPDCRVIFISNNNHSLIFCRPSDNEFNELVLDSQDCFHCATSFEGKLYGLNRMSLVVLDFSGPTPHFVQIMSEALHLSPQFIISLKTYMIESGGDLLMIEKMFHGYYGSELFGFSIYQADLASKTWVKVTSIGERTIFLDSHDGISFSASEKSGIKRNFIYFTQSSDRYLYAFSLEKQRVSFSMPCSNVSRRDSSFHWVVGSKQKEILGHEVSVMTSTSSDHLVHDKIKHGERGSSNWSDLPPELLSMILSNLFLGDSSNFRATCRSWQSITTPFPPPTNSALSKLPYLMILNGGDDGCKFFQPLRNETYHDKLSNIIISNDELKDAKIRVSKYGWLLMSGGGTIFFFNPFTEVIIKLPNIYWANDFMSVSFSSPPTSSDCLVIGICWGFLHIELCIIKRGDDRWTFHEFQNNRRFALYDASPPVLYNGKLYCLGNGGDVGVLDLSSGLSWSIICCCKPILAWPRFKYQCQKSFMVNCDGGMLVVFVTHEERRVRLIKLIVPDMEWQDVQSLGNKMLFLSHGASLLVEAVKEGMANKIYFPNFHGENGVFYSLDTGKYHSIVGNYSSTTPFNFVEQVSSTCTWIEAIYDDDHTTTGVFQDW